MNVDVWVDGACSGNPGPGGYGVALQYTRADGSLYSKELSGGHRNTTNNQMELCAVLAAVEALKLPCNVTVHTDSQLVIGWMSLGWKRNNAVCKALCVELEAVVTKGGHTVTYVKVKGHAGVALNERCDVLAREAIEEQQADEDIARDGDYEKLIEQEEKWFTEGRSLL